MRGTMVDGDVIARPALPWNFKLWRLKPDWAPGDVFAILHPPEEKPPGVPGPWQLSRTSAAVCGIACRRAHRLGLGVR